MNGDGWWVVESDFSVKLEPQPCNDRPYCLFLPMVINTTSRENEKPRTSTKSTILAKKNRSQFCPKVIWLPSKNYLSSPDDQWCVSFLRSLKLMSYVRQMSKYQTLSEKQQLCRLSHFIRSCYSKVVREMVISVPPWTSFTSIKILYQLYIFHLCHPIRVKEVVKKTKKNSKLVTSAK